MKFFLAVLFLLLGSNLLCAQTIDKKKLDEFFDVLQNRGLATGGVAIALDGKTVYERAVGFAALDGDDAVPSTVTTKYRIGSVSKLFTAVMIFQLIEERKLRLDKKLSTWFPGIPNADKITVKNMLYHRSGVHDYTHDTNFQEWMSQPKTHDEILKIIIDKGIDFAPDAKADYSNSNYLLLSYIIESICRMSYGQALEKRIISKLGLKNTYYGGAIDISKKESISYKYADARWNKEKETDLSIHVGAGSIVSTPGDLIIFIQHLFKGDLISIESLNQMKTMIDGYGMGIFPFDFESEEGYGHSGRIEEFYSTVRYFPRKKLALSYVTNGILFPRVDILKGILKICFNEEYTIPFSKSIVLQDRDLDQPVGQYASGDLPFKVNCIIENKKLVFEFGGKKMEVEPVNTHYFMNLPTGSFFEFNPAKGELQIKETDNVYYLLKEK